MGNGISVHIVLERPSVQSGGSLSGTVFLHLEMALSITTVNLHLDCIEESGMLKRRNVLLDYDKVLKTFESEEKNAEEVTQAWVQGKILEENSLSQFSIPNRYFEEIPLELVTDVISGEGRISPEDIETCIDDLRELYMIAFR